MTFDAHVLVARYGYLTIFALIFVESVGIPLPGEAVLVAGALYAARTHRLDPLAIVAVATLAASSGSMLGYGLGRWIGEPVLQRFGRFIGLTEGRQRIGRYLFLRHGATIVFWGRFLAILRTFAGLLAGMNEMGWRRFALFNALGAALWAATVTTAAYVFGRAFAHLAGPASLALGAAAVVAVCVALVWGLRREADLQRKADAVLAHPAA
ncbi:DedA family protein [Caulobacter sp. KR2-114]|uniref:DedA family protein n=1 Tax=Caulobacter sp. KR2-114 TaxID=3400912 RepID=UPI003C094D75